MPTDINAGDLHARFSRSAKTSKMVTGFPDPGPALTDLAGQAQTASDTLR